MEVLDAIMQRRSIRAYTEEQITPQQRQALIDAGLQAPSAVNSQPWHFTVVQDRELIKEINAVARRELLQETQGRIRKRFEPEEYSIFFDAPTVIFISGDASPQMRYAWLDCGIAAENIVLAAQGMGLGSVILGMPRAAFEAPEGERFAQILGFPQGYEFKIAVAIGHPAMGKEAHVIRLNKVKIIE